MKLNETDVFPPLVRFRLRKKTWKNPGTVFLDYHVYEEDINISSNWEVFLEVLAGKGHVYCFCRLNAWLPNRMTEKYNVNGLTKQSALFSTLNHSTVNFVLLYFMSLILVSNVCSITVMPY